MKKYFVILMLFLFLFLFTSCKEEELIKLDTPVVTIDESGLACWKEIDNSNGYAYRINHGIIQDTDSLSIQLNEYDLIEVKALGDGKKYVDSEFSKIIQYIKIINIIKLESPSLKIVDGIAIWDNVVNASSYIYELNGVEYPTNDLFVELEPNDRIRVKALGDGVYYSDSEYSSELVYEIVPIKLETPTVSVDEKGNVTWNNILNASSYAYSINNQDDISIIGNSVLLNDGDSLRVKAIGDGVYYSDSDYSVEIFYYAPIKLGIPNVSVNNSGVASWSAVPFASSYCYKINNGDEVITDNLFIQLQNGDSIVVKAVGDIINYSDGEYSNILTFINSLDQIKLAVPNVSIDEDGLVSWTGVENAVKYGYILNDEVEVITEGFSVQLEDNDVIKIRAIGDNINYLNSNYSEEITFVYVPVLLEIKFINIGSYQSETIIDFYSNNQLTIDDLPVISGYKLVKCYTDSNCLNEYSFDLVFEDLTLYLKWERSYDENIINSLNLYIDDLLNETTSYVPSWNQEGFKGRWNYIDGVFLNSIVNLYESTNDVKYKNFLINYINYYIDSNGNFINPSTQESGYRTGELDSVCESRILFDAYRYTNDNRYLTAINTTYQELINMPITMNGYSYSHKSSYLNQIWLDGMYMYVPFYARYGLMVNDSTIFDNIVKQYKYIRDYMFDEEKQLYYHGHDTSKSIFWADSQTGNSESFWLRSMGWYMVSLVDAIEYFEDGVNKDYLISLLAECIEGIMKYQDEESKMFYQLIDQGDISVLVSANYLSKLKNTKYMVNGSYVDTYIDNYLESSGSSMIAYTLLKASRLGYIDGDYYSLGIEVFEGVYNHSFKNGSLNDICITSGLGPESKTYRDGSLAYYLAEPVGSDDAKGVGPFIMAFLEYQKNNE